MTVFLTTHYMEEAATADYVVILDSGSIVEEGTPHELKEKYVEDYILLYGVTEDEVKLLARNIKRSGTVTSLRLLQRQRRRN